MKKIIYSVIALLGMFVFASCDDMLEVENTSMVQNPELNQKTDSVFFALGIAQAIQELADQYYFIGEMKGDLVSTNANTSLNLKELNTFSESETNVYTSARPYYKIINNCNYYLEHRDTALYTGATNVAINEYAAVAAWRAWAYLMLARTYGEVPFFTKPLTSISEIDSEYEKLGLSAIVSRLAPDLEKFSAMSVEVPTFSTASYLIGKTNWGQDKNINPSKIFIPVDVVLGEMYLENGEYENAAKKYCKYLGEHQLTAKQYGNMSDKLLNQLATNESLWGVTSLPDWLYIYASSVNEEIVTYVPMAVSSQLGTTTNIPLAYGYDYYQLSRSSTCPRVDEIQIEPSKAFWSVADNTPVYFFALTARALNNSETDYPDSIGFVRGDTRANKGTSTRDEYMFNQQNNDTTKLYIRKNSFGNVYLYRVSTIYLHLAEAFNGMGYYDAAFAVLKNGISGDLKYWIKDDSSDKYKYLSREAYDMLVNRVPFLSTYKTVFEPDNSNGTAFRVYGMHLHGAGLGGGYTEMEEGKGTNQAWSTLDSHNNLLYLPEPVLSERLKKIAENYGVTVGENAADSAAAMLDVLCDEYAMEFAFEGTRFYDLQRMARHFNEMGVFGGNFGDIWLRKKLENQAGNITTQNCYLPFK